MQLALQAADLFREPKGFAVRRRQTTGESLNLTLKETEKDRKIQLST